MVHKPGTFPRSAQMRSIRKTNTKPELAVRKLVHALGYRFRLHRRDVPGTPDLAFIGARKAIFVHGCFWHQHRGCRWAKLPRARPEYWLPKLARNQERDGATLKRLDDLGWKTLVIWECEVAVPAVVQKKIKRFLSGKR
jgi:DNA mismatch endonuclease (patch repair protein)